MLSPYSKPSSWASGTVFATSSCWVKIFTLKLLSSGLLHAAASLVPHGTKLMLSTVDLQLSTFRVDKHDPEVMSHVLMVLSSEPLTTMLGLSGLKTTHLT